MGCCQTSNEATIAETIISEKEDTLSPLEVSQQGISQRYPPQRLELEQIPSFSTADEAQSANIQYPVDLHLFQQFMVNDDCHRDIDRECESLKRIKSVVRYHPIVSVEQLVHFCDSYYPKQALLEDYIHFVDRHCDHNSIQCISDDLSERIKCIDLNQCTAIKRHYDIASEQSSESNHFCVDLVDSLHLNIFHLKTLGLRDSMQIEEERKQIEDPLIDRKMDSMNHRIQRAKRRFYINRLDDVQNSKFNLCIHRNAGNLFMDTLSTFAIDSGHYVLVNAVVDGQYDTDSVNEDLQIWQQDGECNLFSVDSMHIAVKTVLNSKTKSRSFSTGIQFWYWPYYKNIDNADDSDTERLSGSNVEGRTVSDLYVSPIFGNLKEEVMATNLISMKHFEQRVIAKASEYIQTAKCRTIQRNRDRLHLNVRTFSLQHLYAIILFTDFIAFSNALAESFVKLEWTESVEDIRARNGHFHFTSKLLREAVYLFGLDGYRYGSKNGNESGPFFVSTTSVMPIPEFSLSFCGLTSMSKNIEIAWRSAGSEGMVLRMDNMMGYAKKERFFNGSWISRFPEESERIFGGTTERVSLSAIINVQSFRNYRVSVSAFNKLDCILRGEKELHKMRISSKEVGVIHDAIDWALTGKLSMDRNEYLDPFILECFDLFTLRTTDLVLNFEFMAKMKDQRINEMFMGPIQRQNVEHDVYSKCNLLRWTLFGVFLEMTSIKIIAKYHAFNLEAFVSVLSGHEWPRNLEEIVIEDGQSWLKGYFGRSAVRKTIQSLNKTFYVDFDGRNVTSIRLVEFQ